MKLICWLFYVFFAVIVSTNATSVPPVTSDDVIDNGAMQRQLYNLLAEWVRDQKTTRQATDETTVLQNQIKSLEKRIEDYEEDRKQWTSYASVIIETQSRLIEFEREKHTMQTTLQQLKRTEQEFKEFKAEVKESQRECRAKVTELRENSLRFFSDIKDLQLNSQNVSLTLLDWNRSDLDTNDKINDLKHGLHSANNAIQEIRLAQVGVNEFNTSIQSLYENDKIRNTNIQEMQNDARALDDSIHKIEHALQTVLKDISELHISSEFVNESIQCLKTAIDDTKSGRDLQETRLDHINVSLSDLGESVKTLNPPLQELKKNIYEMKMEDKMANISIQNLQTNALLVNINMREIVSDFEKVKSDVRDFQMLSGEVNSNIEDLKTSQRISQRIIRDLQEHSQVIRTKLLNMTSKMDYLNDTMLASTGVMNRDINDLRITTRQVEVSTQELIINTKRINETTMYINDTIHQTIALFSNRTSEITENFENYDQDLQIIIRVMNRLQENWNEKFTDSNEKQKQDLRNVTGTMRELQEDVLEQYREVKSNISMLISDIEAVEYMSANLTRSITSLNSSLSGNLDNLTTDLNILQRKHNYPMVTFSGRLKPSGTYGSGPLVFSTSVLSTGGGYRYSDGKFYPPVSGWYMFDVTIIAGSVSKSAYAYLVKNGNDVMYIYSGYDYTSTNSKPSGSRAITIYLDIGDTAWVRGVGYNYYIYSSLSITLITK